MTISGVAQTSDRAILCGAVNMGWKRRGYEWRDGIVVHGGRRIRVA